MTQQPDETAIVPVSGQFAAQIPSEPQPSPQVSELTSLAVTPEKREQLSCRLLLVGDTLVRAEAEAAETLSQMLENRQIFAVFGTDTLEGVNQLNERMLNGRPPVNVPELEGVMKDLSRSMRGLGRKYDPSDPKVLEKYERVKGGILSKIGLVKTFFEEFMDDIRSLQGRFEVVIEKLEGKQHQLIRNVAYYDEFYDLNEQEIDRLIYKIAVMEMIRDLAAEQASRIVIGDSTLGDRGGEQKAEILELVTLLENKIAAFKGRLWVAWAMSPQIRNMRAISLGLSARIDQTVGITIPTMKGVIVIWLTLSEAEQAEKFNKAVEDAFNQSMAMFANAAKASIPAMANALATPALDPRTVLAWSESLSAQADGIVQALELGIQKRAELDKAIIEGKKVIDEATEKVNQAQLQHVLAIAQEKPPEIIKSVPAPAQN